MPHVDGWAGIFTELVGNLRCAKCGQPYARKAMSLVGVKADHHFVRCSCERCKVEAVAVVIVKEVVVRHVVDDPVMTEDDVMDAAEILRRSPTLTLKDLGFAAN